MAEQVHPANNSMALVTMLSCQFSRRVMPLCSRQTMRYPCTLAPTGLPSVPRWGSVLPCATRCCLALPCSTLPCLHIFSCGHNPPCLQFKRDAVAAESGAERQVASLQEQRRLLEEQVATLQRQVDSLVEVSIRLEWLAAVSSVHKGAAQAFHRQQFSAV